MEIIDLNKQITEGEAIRNQMEYFYKDLKNEHDNIYKDLKNEHDNLHVQNVFMELLLVLLVIGMIFNCYVLYKAFPLIDSVLEKQQVIERTLDSYGLIYEEP